MTNKPEQPSQATRLQFQLNLNTPTHQLPLQGDPQSRSPIRVNFWNNYQISHLTGLATPGCRGHTHAFFHSYLAIAKKENQGKNSFKKETIKRQKVKMLLV